MTWPFTFGTLTSPAQLSDFDANFNQTAAMIEIPSSASGTNAISLTPLVNCPVLTAYTEFCAARFRAVGNSTATVTAQFNGLGFLPVYHNDGVTQASTNDLVAGFEYVVRFSQALNAAAGGWFLEAPAVPVAAAITTAAPGGRLTFQSAVPVMTSTQAAPQTIFYAPYVSPFAPIYNGSTIQMYQFTASQSDQMGLSLVMGGSASWPAATNFDVFVTLVAGLPTLCTIAWTNSTTRATNLAIFGGFLTNASPATARTGAATTIALAVNQGTFLGTFRTVGATAGQSIYQFGGAASGGTPAFFFLCNYYNKVSVNTIVQDNGAAYTYTSSTVRVARNSTNNEIIYIQSDSERLASFFYNAGIQTVAAANANAVTGIGFNSTTVFSGSNVSTSVSAAVPVTAISVFTVATTGIATVAALQQGDNVNANTFDSSSVDQLFGNIWL
jgi:hypothetical protein